MQPPTNTNTTEKNISRPNGNQPMKLEIPLLSPQHKSSSQALPENRRGTFDLDKAVENELKHGSKLDPEMDNKKLRRLISNRLSAQKARVRKAMYIKDLEKMVRDLEEYVAVLNLHIESYKERRKMLLVQYDSLRRLLEIRSNESRLYEIELEKNRLEVLSLKELERILSKNRYDSNAGGQQMQDLISKQLITPNYTSIGFYEDGLRKLASKQFRQGQVSSSTLEQPGKAQ